MTRNISSIELPSEADTARLAQRLSRFLSVGDVVLLTGEIGAGKSAFARAVIRALLGEDTEVPSPTFTLVQAYPYEDYEIWHADLYRLTDPDEAMELGLLEAFEEDVCLVEWPDRLGPYMPSDALEISLEAQAACHKATFNGDPRWAGILAQVLGNE